MASPVATDTGGNPLGPDPTQLPSSGTPQPGPTQAPQQQPSLLTTDEVKQAIEAAIIRGCNIAENADAADNVEAYQRACQGVMALCQGIAALAPKPAPPPPQGSSAPAGRPPAPFGRQGQ